MARRSTYRSGTLLVIALLLAALGATGTASASATGSASASGTRAGTATKAGSASGSKAGTRAGTRAGTASGAGIAAAQPPHRYFHEFQANCAVSHTGPDDPIVFPGQPGASHNHTFMGNTTTDADSTVASLDAGGTTCKAPGDKSAYWMPTLFDGDWPVLPVGPQTIYYKAGVTDYTSVHPFPKGLRFVVGSPAQSPQDFRDHPGYVEGWECGDSYFNTEFPTDCPDRSDVQLNIRLQAPSCWDGSSLDSADHRSHMAYPVVKEGTNDNVCPADHPVALPMIEFKMAFPVNGDLSAARLASGPSYSFHYDFFNAWDDATLDALVDHCIVGGLQCDARGYDQTHPEEGAALNEDYELPAGVAAP